MMTNKMPGLMGILLLKIGMERNLVKNRLAIKAARRRGIQKKALCPEMPGLVAKKQVDCTE